MPIQEILDVGDMRALRAHVENLGEYYIFRGQESDQWPLQSSLERSIRRASLIQNIPNREHWLVHEFARRYSVYGSHPAPTNKVDWLAIMQHHGCPTRLLDFTYSCYVGLYFAVIDAKGQDAVLWAVSLPALRHAARKIFSLEKRDIEGQTLRDEIRRIHHQALESIVCSDTVSPQQGVLIIEPSHMTARLLRQQGLFLAPTDLLPRVNTGPTFMENLAASLKVAQELRPVVHDHIVKIRIPAHMHREALLELSRMNVNAETLFPGLEGLARSMEQLVVLGY